MTRLWMAVCVFLSLGLLACGPKVPQHSGYKTKAPWKKAKPFALTDGQGKVKGTLDYADYKRAKWYALDLPSNGDLNLDLQFEPTDDAGDATVAMEVLDSTYHVISEDEDAPLVAPDKEDGDDEAEEEEDDEEEEEDDDDGGEGENTQKVRGLDSLPPGRYYIHLFVTKRMDSAEFTLQAAFTPMEAAIKTNFPKSVAWVPSLPQVPVADDAPDQPVKKDDKKDDKKGGGKKHGGGKKVKPVPEETPEDPPPETGKTAVNADVVDVSPNDSGGSTITFNAGTNDGLAAGRKGTLKGVKNGSFSISSCTANACKASVKASADEVKKSSMTVKIP